LVAGGKPLGRASPVYAQINEEMDKLRAANDKILAEVSALDKSREDLIAASDRQITEISDKGKADGYVQGVVETLSQIEELERRTAEMRSSQIQNYLNIGALKRQRVFIEKSEKALGLAEQVYAVLDEEAAGSDVEALAASMSEVVLELREEFDSFAKEIMKTKKDIDNKVGFIRSIELTLRAKRGKADHETDALRTSLESGLYEARRKNAKLTRYRIQQALNVKLIAVLERARQSLQRHSDIQVLLSSGDKEQMEMRVKMLLRDIELTNKTAQELRAKRAAFTKEVSGKTEQLRKFAEIVTPETGALREQLIEALREESLCIGRLAVLRRVQAQDVKLLARLGKALAV